MIKLYNENSNIQLDDGIFFAKSIFETILIKDSAIFLDEHIERANKSLEKLRIKNKIFKNDVIELINKENLKDCVLKIVISDKNIIATTRKIIYNDKDYNNGFNLDISLVKRNSSSILSYLKTTSYIENILERNKAKEYGYDEILFLNEKEFISECSMSNVFWIKDKKIYTSSVNCGLLSGIIREWIINEFDVITGEYSIGTLLECDEVFITNSVMGIMSVNNIKNYKFESRNITNKIREKYNKVLEEL